MLCAPSRMRTSTSYMFRRFSGIALFSFTGFAFAVVCFPLLSSNFILYLFPLLRASGALFHLFALGGVARTLREVWGAHGRGVNAQQAHRPATWVRVCEVQGLYGCRQGRKIIRNNLEYNASVVQQQDLNTRANKQPLMKHQS